MRAMTPIDNNLLLARNLWRGDSSLVDNTEKIAHLTKLDGSGIRVIDNNMDVAAPDAWVISKVDTNSTQDPRKLLGWRFDCLGTKIPYSSPIGDGISSLDNNIAITTTQTLKAGM